MSNPMSRRDMLKSSALTIAAVATGGALVDVTRAQSAPPAAPPSPVPPGSPASAAPRRVLRFAHPTDIHVEPELGGARGMAKAFQHMMALQDKPGMILTGGDLPMDTASSDHARSAQLWDLFKKVLGDNVPPSVPIHHTIGNHDIWGRDKAACRATGNEPDFGRKWFLENFNYKKTYHSFDNAGWHFIVLDSFDLDQAGPDYTARIVGEQIDWLKADLAATPSTTPIVVTTHVPIISAVNFFEHESKAHDDRDMTISRLRMHVDHRNFDDLFQRYRNVKLCLSGHIHQLDRVDYNDVTYICDGAVCGDKWKGSRRHTPEGYGLIDLFADGTFAHRYVTYGWHAQRG